MECLLCTRELSCCSDCEFAICCDIGIGGVRGKRNVGDMGDMLRSKIDNGEAGKRGDAIGKSAPGLGWPAREGEKRKGLCGDTGDAIGTNAPGDVEAA